jgi:hypothetical protein
MCEYSIKILKMFQNRKKVIFAKTALHRKGYLSCLPVLEALDAS